MGRLVIYFETQKPMLLNELEEGMVTLKEAGMMKVRQGLTSLEAAFEVTGGE